MRCARCVTADPRTTSVVIAERASPVRAFASPHRWRQRARWGAASEAVEAPGIEVQDSGAGDPRLTNGHCYGAGVATTYSASKMAEREACNPPGWGLQTAGRWITVRHAAASITDGSRRHRWPDWHLHRPHGAYASLLTPGVTHARRATHAWRAQRAGDVANSPRCSLVTSLPCPSLRLRSAPLAARSLSTSVRWNSAAYIAAV